MHREEGVVGVNLTRLDQHDGVLPLVQPEMTRLGCRLSVLFSVTSALTKF